jgi:hypothetical protein
MSIEIRINCPNCGCYAEKKDFSDKNITEIACDSCDYLMVKCSLTGRVIEAYAPGIGKLKPQLKVLMPVVDRKQHLRLVRESSVC